MVTSVAAEAGAAVVVVACVVGGAVVGVAVVVAPCVVAGAAVDVVVSSAESPQAVATIPITTRTAMVVRYLMGSPSFPEPATVALAQGVGPRKLPSRRGIAAIS